LAVGAFAGGRVEEGLVLVDRLLGHHVEVGQLEGLFEVLEGLLVAGELELLDDCQDLPLAEEFAAGTDLLVLLVDSGEVHAALWLLADGFVLVGVVPGQFAVLDLAGGRGHQGLGAVGAFNGELAVCTQVHVLRGFLGAADLEGHVEGELVAQDLDVLGHVEVVGGLVFVHDFPEVGEQGGLILGLDTDQHLLHFLSAVVSGHLLEDGVLACGVLLDDGLLEGADGLPLAVLVLGREFVVELELGLGLE